MEVNLHASPSQINMMTLGALEMDESRLRIIFKKLIEHGATGACISPVVINRCKELLNKPHELGGFYVGY